MTENSCATVLVVDDFPEWRSRIRETLQRRPEWKIIAEASDGEEAVYKATGTDNTGSALSLAYQADMGFSKGKFIGTDGRVHHGTQVFV
jgi:hypothetical protein